MSSSDIAISVRGLGKAYTIRHQRPDAPTTLAEALTSRLRHPFARRSDPERFWVLKDVSFDVKRGEVVGVIGRNGAGKSTLLKILSRITEMTEGEADLYGRVGSLLEVGTGFHQELTGRENIFLNGAILGMTRGEIRRQFDAIVDFAGVEKFLDTPVKRYSSGMYVRLAFAVAAHLRSEILIVDEVLAVGDAEFQKKCLGKMKEVSTDGRTVLFVSHNMAAVQRLCTAAVHLLEGTTGGLGNVEAAIRSYEMTTVPLRIPDDGGRRGTVIRDVRVVALHANGAPSVIRCGRGLVIRIQYTSDVSIARAKVAIGILTRGGERLAWISNEVAGKEVDIRPGGGEITCTIEHVPLVPGIYCLNLHLSKCGDTIDWVQSAAEFEVIAGDCFGTGLLPQDGWGKLLLSSSWTTN